MSMSPKREAARHPDHNLCLSRSGITLTNPAGVKQTAGRPAIPPIRSQSVMPGHSRSKTASLPLAYVPDIHVVLAEPL